MFFLGVVTNQKNESYIKNKLSKVLPSENIIFITDKNILNVKNIKFETIIIDAKKCGKKYKMWIIYNLMS